MSGRYTIPMPDFSPIARFYDLDDGRLTEDISLYLGFARKTSDPVLDLGVGSARLALPLASAGYDVTGVDISAEMLALGRARIMRAGLSRHIHLIQADFIAPPLEQNRFALAYCGYNAFLHLTEGEEQMRALKNWRALLRPGGLLVIDVENPQLEALAGLSEALELEEVLLEPETGRAVRKHTAAWANLPDQVLYLHRVYETDDGRWETSFQVRILFQRELALLLACADFTALRFYGDYDLTPWEPDSPRLIAVAANDSEAAATAL